jgi:predicted  nucleic acid-binding Zn-ribbon protein
MKPKENGFDAQGFIDMASATGIVTGLGVAAAGVITGGIVPALIGGVIVGTGGTLLAANSKLGLLRDDKQKALQELAVANHKCRELEAKLADVDKQRQQLADRLEVYLEGSSPKLLDIPIVRARIVDLMRQISGLDAQLAAANKEISVLNSQLNSLTGENQQLKTQLDQVSAKYLAESQAHQELIEEFNRLEIVANRTTTEIEREVQLRVLTSLQEYSREAVAKAIESKVLELQQAQEIIKKLQAELNDDHQTLSDIKENVVPAIRQKFDGEVNARDQMMMRLSGQVKVLEGEIEKLKAPRLFRGNTAPDNTGNQIIRHFAAYGIVLDALESIRIPGGFKLRFRVDRNEDFRSISEQEFDKCTSETGLFGLSTKPLDFHLDRSNFILSVDIFTGFGDASKATRVATKTTELAPIATRFHDLNCHSADEWEDVIRAKFCARVWVIAASQGGKSPLLELAASAIAKVHGGQLILINPIPGSQKDWFHVPGLIQPGCDGIAEAIKHLESLYKEFKYRRDNLNELGDKPFITIMVDEINAISRQWDDIGCFMKDFWQLSDHTKMSLCLSGQASSVSAFSGDAKVKGANKLRREDYQNSTRIFTSEAAKEYLKNEVRNGYDMLNNLIKLEKLCDDLNAQAGLIARPEMGSKKVSPDAYRVALIVSPGHEPFFCQIPPYGSYGGTTEGVTFPDGAKVTSPHLSGGETVAPSAISCHYCGSSKIEKNGTYKDGTQRYRCRDCGKTVDPRKSK